MMHDVIYEVLYGVISLSVIDGALLRSENP